jgi:hypothetical protein
LLPLFQSKVFELVFYFQEVQMMFEVKVDGLDIDPKEFLAKA